MAGASAASAETSLESPPAGANDFGCKPSPVHPRPVVLVHGLGAKMGENWGYLSPLLAAEGYCVFALTYGMDADAPPGMDRGGVIPIEESAVELKAFVRRVLDETGAVEVDLVGHSEGTFMPQYWLKFLGGAKLVRRYVALTPLYRGTQLARADLARDTGAMLGFDDEGIAFFSTYCGSCQQFVAGSEMVKKLSEGDPAVPGVDYTTIPTIYDELVVPWQSGLLDAPNATNRVLQEVCPADTSEHAAEAFDPVVAQIAFNALDPGMAREVSCDGAATFSGPAPGYRPGLHLLETTLRARVARRRVKRLRLRSIPAGARLTVRCADKRRSCPFGSRSARVTRAQRVRDLKRLFRRRPLRPGTRISVAVLADGVRGKRFTLRIGRHGRARLRTACLTPGGSPAAC